MDQNEAANIGNIGSNTGRSKPVAKEYSQGLLPTLLTLLIGSILIAGEGYLIKVVLEHSVSLGRIEGQQGETVRRVDRIANALPDVKAKVAHELIYQSPVIAVLLNTKPTKDAEGKLVHQYHIVDTRTGTVYTYVHKIENEAEFQKAKYSIIGVACNLENSCTSIRELTRLVSLVKDPIPISVPANIDTESSFVMRSVDADKFLQSWEPVHGRPDFARKIFDKDTINNGYNLLVDFRANDDKYRLLNQSDGKVIRFPIAPEKGSRPVGPRMENEVTIDELFDGLKGSDR